MSIHYKSKTEKVFSKIDIPESYINVLELKKRIIDKDKIDMKQDFRFTLADELGMNEYQDEESIMKNVSVLYKIEPLISGEVGIMKKINSIGKKPGRWANSAAVQVVTVPGMPSMPSMPSMPASSQTTRSRAKPTFTMSAPYVVPAGHGIDEIPPPDYLCKRCFVKGHFEENCPTQMDTDWGTKMRKWSFMVSRGIPTERLVRIDDPLSVETLLKLGKTVVRHPQYKHLCTVETAKINSSNLVTKIKIDTPAIFHCYTENQNHIIEDAVILPCCCQVIGCRNHIADLLMESNMTCPECKEKVTLTRIRSLRVLNQSIQKFAEQSKDLDKLGPATTEESSVISKEDSDRSRGRDTQSHRRNRSQSRERSRRSHHRSQHHHRHRS